MLNYSSWPQRDPADGYLFISPDFAPEFANTQVVNQFRADLKTKVIINKKFPKKKKII